MCEKLNGFMTMGLKGTTNGGSHHMKSKSHLRRAFVVGEEVEPFAGGTWDRATIVELHLPDSVLLSNHVMTTTDQIRRILLVESPINKQLKKEGKLR
jgi:hypothetical protein